LKTTPAGIPLLAQIKVEVYSTRQNPYHQSRKVNEGQELMKAMCKMEEVAWTCLASEMEAMHRPEEGVWIGESP